MALVICVGTQAKVLQSVIAGVEVEVEVEAGRSKSRRYPCRSTTIESESGVELELGLAK